MSLPTAYLTTVKNLRGILDAVRDAQAPKTFTISFLQTLGYKSTADRLIIGVLKSLKFLEASGVPTQRYFEFLDRSQSAKVIATGIREAYSELFQINKNAHELSPSDVKNKLRTLSQGTLSDSVLSKQALTFKALCSVGDFTTGLKEKETESEIEEPPHKKEEHGENLKGLSLGGLVYNIQIVLPESRDKAVYDSLFKSLKEHLL